VKCGNHSLEIVADRLKRPEVHPNRFQFIIAHLLIELPRHVWIGRLAVRICPLVYDAHEIGLSPIVSPYFVTGWRKIVLSFSGAVLRGSPI
jgi:hypothetical protein